MPTVQFVSSLDLARRLRFRAQRLHQEARQRLHCSSEPLRMVQARRVRVFAKLLERIRLRHRRIARVADAEAALLVQRHDPQLAVRSVREHRRVIMLRGA